jgi:hypothetical protein
MTAQLSIFPRVYEHYRPVDWFRVIADLSAVGFGQHAISRELHVSSNTVWAWYNCVSSPNAASAEMLTILHSQIVGGVIPRVR